MIPEIPDFPLCHVEGRNGVGKSLALRLLELCSGAQPYGNAPAEWRSLRESLGTVVVTVTSLSGAQTVEWELTPESWPERPERVNDWLGHVTIDGEEQSLEQAYRLFSFSRIAGDETLTRTISRQIQTNAELMFSWSDRLAPILSTWDVDLRNLSNQLAVEAWVDIERLPKEIDGLKKKIAKETKRLESVRSRLDPIKHALDLRRACDEVPELDDQLASEREALAENERRQADLETRRKQLLSDAMTAGATRDRLEDVEALISRRTTRVRNATLAVTELAAGLGAPTSRAELDALIAHDEARRDELTAERARLDATPALREVTRHVANELAQAIDRGLASEVIAVVDDRDVTVEELAAGVDQQNTRLAKPPPDARTAELDAMIRELAWRIEALHQLADAVQKADRARELLEAGRTEQRNLQQELSADAPQAYEELATELAGLREAELDLREKVQQLERERQALAGSQTLDQLNRSLSEAIIAVGLTTDELNPHLLALQEEDADATEILDRLGDDLAQTEKTLAGARSAFRKAIGALAMGSHWAWLRDALDGSAPDPALDDHVNLGRLQMLAAAVDEATERLNNLRNGLPGIGQQIQELAAAIESRSDIPGRISAGLVHYFERDLLAAFDQPELRRALFNDGRLSRIDLEQMTISWTATGGALRTRPFEAFSSGERVFAYTRARLEVLGSSTARNRVVALDEFGAYVARDRLDELVRFVEHRVLGELADQVVIVLPLARDYVRERDQAGGKPDTLIKSRADAIEKQGYFAERFGPSE